MGWRLGVVAAVVVVMAALVGGRWWWRSREPPAVWAQQGACPRCYGLTACARFSRLQFGCRGLWASLVDAIGVKNVYIVCSDTDELVVIKKLGHDWQLRQLDEKICLPLQDEGHCDFDRLNDPYSLLIDKIENIVTLQNGVMESDEIGLTVCPDPFSVRKIISPSLLSEEQNSVLNRIAIVNTWTIMNINPEPIIMKYINENNAHWPVPVYLGACGRITMQTYEGEMISNYLSEPWISRAKLSINLIKAADTFTFNDSNYRFYLTDISPENIVVNSTETWEPIFVDLENVIIVDKYLDPSNETDDWLSNHTSVVIDCPGCFAFSSEKICSHHLSDHNHYSICTLLEESILNDIPDNILKISPDLPKLIRECVSPSDDNVDRFTAATILRDELNRIITDFKSD